MTTTQESAGNRESSESASGDATFGPTRSVDRRLMIGLAALGLLGIGSGVADGAASAAVRRRAVRRGPIVVRSRNRRRRRGAPAPAPAPAPVAAPAPAPAPVPAAAPAPAPVTAPAPALESFATAGDTVETRRHVLYRTTFGPRPAETAAVDASGVDAWLAAQLAPASIADPATAAVDAAFPLAALTVSQVRAQTAMYSWDAQLQTAHAWLGYQVHSNRQVFEIVVDVMADLLHIAVPSEKVWDSAPDYAFSVLRKHAFGSFVDLLLAAMKHPAMLSFLDNTLSTRTNVNENLGRELLELHTVGVGAGYTEAEVRSSAYILSGRRTDSGGNYVFSSGDHWTGPVSVLGFQHANTDATQGEAVGDAYLSYLARHPSTARNVVRRLAVRFVSDQPSSALLDSMVQAYLGADTAIVPVLKAMFRHPDFWASAGLKARRPLEDLAGAVRLMDSRPTADIKNGLSNLWWYLDGLGHGPLAWPAPNGYPDVTPAWLSASGMIGRWNAHRALAGGWWAGVAPAAPMDQELLPASGGTYGSWIEAIAQRVLHRPLTPAYHAALLTFLGVAENAVVPSWDAWRTPHLIGLLLDSPLWQYR